MTSSNPSRSSSAHVFSATVVAAATVVGLVAYFNGDTYQAGTHEATTLSGTTVTAGGGTQTIDSNGFVATKMKVTGTLTGSRLEIRPASGTGVIRIRSDAGGVGTGGALCIESLAGTMNRCVASGGRLDCDPAVGTQCTQVSN